MAEASGSGSRPRAEEPDFRIERSEAATHAMPLELAAEQASEDLLELYTESIERVQKALQELRCAYSCSAHEAGAAWCLHGCFLFSSTNVELICLLQGGAAEGCNSACGRKGEHSARASSRRVSKSCKYPATSSAPAGSSLFFSHVMIYPAASRLLVYCSCTNCKGLKNN